MNEETERDSRVILYMYGTCVLSCDANVQNVVLTSSRGGRTTVGRFTTIGSRTVVNNAEIGNEVEIGHKCVIGDVRTTHADARTCD